MPKKADVLALLGLAKQYLGTPYQWGGANPKTGFDCSGFVQWLYAQQGVKIPRTTYTQYNVGIAIPKGALRPGDIVFFHKGKNGPKHEGLYIGNGKFIESPGAGGKVRVSSLAGRSDFMGARRVIPGGSTLAELTKSAAPSTPPALASTGPAEGAAAPIPTLGSQPSGLGPAPVGPAGTFAPGTLPAGGFTPRQIAETWRTIAEQPSASPETQDYASGFSG